VIISEIININATRRDRLKKMLEQVLLSSRLYIAGQEKRRKIAPKSFKDIFSEAAIYLIENTYRQLNLITEPTQDFDKDLHFVITESDTSKFIQERIPHKEATDIVRTYIMNNHGRALLLSELVERYERKPCGWKDEDIVLMVARLFRRGDIEIRTDAPLSPKEAFPFLQRRPNWKQVRVGAKQKVSADVLRTAQQTAKQWFNITPQSDESLFVEQLRVELERLQVELAREENAAENKGYPGLSTIRQGRAILDALVTTRESSHLLAAIDERQKEIVSFIEAFDDVKHFYKHQTAHWDSLQQVLAQAKLNETYLKGHKDAEEVLSAVRSIVEDPNPFAKLKDSSKLSGRFEALHGGIVKELREVAAVQIKDSLDSLQKVLAENRDHLNRSVAEFVAPLEQISRDIQDTTILANIEVAGQKARAKAESLAREVYALVAAKSGTPVNETSEAAPPQKLRVSDWQPLGKPLTNPDEVHAFIDKAHSVLLEAVKKGPVYID
jgi:hypothetical protein